MKRIILLLLVVTLMFQNVSFADMSKDTQKEQEIFKVLASLSIFKGDGEGNFNPEKTITREEYTALILRILGLENMVKSYSGNSNFTDVAEGHWAFSYIGVAKDIGIVDGIDEKLFGLGAKINLQEATKILVCALGYRDMGESLGGYPNGYSAAATRLHLMKGIESSGDFTRAKAARMIYNSLSVDIIDEFGNFTEGKTVLNTYLNVNEFTGVLESTYNLQDEKWLNYGYIRVSGNTYYAPGQNYDDMIGSMVVCYASDDDTIIYHIRQKSDVDEVSVRADDIVATTTLSEFVYLDEKGDMDRLRLSSELKLYVNGLLVTKAELAKEKLMPENGKVSLKDTDNDGSYDIVVVQSYRNYVINYFDGEIIYDKFGRKLDFDDYKGDAALYKDEVEFAQQDLVNGDVLSVMESADGKRGMVYVSDACVTGKIVQIETLVEGKPIFVIMDSDGNKNRLEMAENYSAALKNGREGVIMPSVSSKNIYKFYVDAFGDIADISAVNVEDDYIYGFLYAKALSDNSLSSRAMFEVLTLNNRFEKFSTPKGENILFGRASGGVYKVSKEDAATIVEAISEKQLIKYALNSLGEIVEIFIANTTLDNEYFSREPIDNTEKTYYNKVIDQYWVVDADTAVFSINVSAKYKDAMYAGDYVHALKDGVSADMIYYDTEGAYVGALVLSGTYLKRYETKLEGYEFPINMVNSPVLYINSITKEMAEDGEIYTVLNGYQDGKEKKIALNKELEYYSEPKENLKAGIAIQYTANEELKRRALTSDMIPVILTFKTVFDFTVDNNEGAMWEYTSTKNKRARISTFWGDVETGNDEYLSIIAGDELYSAAINDQTMMLRYDDRKNRFELIENEGAFFGQTVFVRQRYSNTRELVFYER